MDFFPCSSSRRLGPLSLLLVLWAASACRKPDPPRADPPKTSGELSGTLPAEQVARLKRATALVRTKAGSGSGFVVVVPPGDQDLLIYRFEPEALAAAAAANGPVILSAANLVIARGAHFSYAINAHAKTPLTFSLVVGPPGMGLSSSGIVRWEVPRPSPPAGRFIVRATDQGGAAAEQSFEYTFM